MPLSTAALCIHSHINLIKSCDLALTHQVTTLEGAEKHSVSAEVDSKSKQ